MYIFLIFYFSIFCPCGRCKHVYVISSLGPSRGLEVLFVLTDFAETMLLGKATLQYGVSRKADFQQDQRKSLLRYLLDDDDDAADDYDDDYDDGYDIDDDNDDYDDAGNKDVGHTQAGILRRTRKQLHSSFRISFK